jgi:hypothetical protein
VGKAQEVYPSEESVLDKGNLNFFPSSLNSNAKNHPTENFKQGAKIPTGFQWFCAVTSRHKKPRQAK